MNSLRSFVAGKLIEKKLTRAELCEALGVSHATLNRKLKGETELTLREALKLSDCLEIDVRDIGKMFKD